MHRPNLQSGGSGGAVTAYSNTWALGALAPGKTATFVWRVTAVQPGVHVVAWEVAAGLNGKAKAIGARKGTITVLIRKAPAQDLRHELGQGRHAAVAAAPGCTDGRVVLRTPGSSLIGALSRNAARGERAALRPARLLPDVQRAVDGVAVDLLELVGVEVEASSAATFCSSWATLLAPSSAEVTRGSRRAQAIAICASVWPRRRAISFSARTRCRLSS